MKTNNKTTKAIRTMSAGLLAAAMGTMLLLNGCAGGGGASTASTTTWPSTTPPATSQKNTYVGTQSPGWYMVTIDHSSNTFSYQDLSTNAATVSGTFTTAANGFLVLTTSTGAAAYGVEQLSRAVLLVPAATATSIKNPSVNNVVFAVVAPSCQVIPARTKFGYIASPNPYYSNVGVEETYIGSGTFYASTDPAGANWAIGGEVQYGLPGGLSGSLVAPYDPSPDPISVTCMNNGGTAEMQTTITVPNSLAANFAVGPTGFFVEDRYQSDQTAFVGAVEPPLPVDLSGLSSATFLGMNAGGGESSANSPAPSFGELISATAALDSSGKSIELTGATFPSNDPSQTPVPTFDIDLGGQDPNNNGYFPSATYTGTCSSCSGTPVPSYALVTQAGGKYAIFVASSTGTGLISGWLLFQQ